MSTRRLLATAVAPAVATATAVATAGLVLVPLAGTAAAHVTVSAPGATQGGFTKLVFRTPTERDVPTTRLEVALPTGTPIASVSVKPKAGWDYQLVKAAPAEPFEAFGEPVTEVVTRIVWTASGAGIGPDEFDEFEVSAGPLPEDVETLEFPALQTYGDGEVVRWIEQTPEGGEQPERPAPVLALASADGSGSGDGAAVRPASAQVESTPSAEDDASTALAGTALGLGVLALAAAGYAVAVSRRTP